MAPSHKASRTTRVLVRTEDAAGEGGFGTTTLLLIYLLLVFSYSLFSAVVLDLTPVRSLLVQCSTAVGQETLTDGGGKRSRIVGVGTLSEEETEEKEKVRI